MGVPRSKENQVKRLKMQLKKHKECPEILDNLNKRIKTLEKTRK